MKSKARSTVASAVKIDESSGIRYILLCLSDITAQPTFESSFTHQYTKFSGKPGGDLVAGVSLYSARKI